MNFGKKLKTLRDMFGYTLEDAYLKTNISMSSLSDFERNKREPSLSQLQLLANLYHKTVSFFLEDNDVLHPKMLWRDKPDSDLAKTELEGKFYKLCKQYQNLEVWSKTPKKNNFEKLISEFPENYSQVEILASTIFDILKIGDKPGNKLFNVLEEEYFIKIFHEDFAGSAVSYYDDIIGPAIMLNKSNKQWRRNFDLAHELFHLITWYSRPESGELSELEESFANCFASEILMPRGSVLKSVEDELSKDRKIDSYFIDTLARQYEVSYDALLIRIKKLYKITLEKTDIYRISETLKSIFTSRESNTPSTFPERYETLAIDCLMKGEISMSQCAKYLEKSVSELMNLNLHYGSFEDEIKIPADIM